MYIKNDGEKNERGQLLSSHKPLLQITYYTYIHRWIKPGGERTECDHGVWAV